MSTWRVDTTEPRAGRRRLSPGRVDPYLFLTNYPSQTPEDLRERFRQAGLEVPADRFYTSAMAAAGFLQDQPTEHRRAFVVGDGALVHALCQVGFRVSETDAGRDRAGRGCPTPRGRRGSACARSGTRSAGASRPS